jgi:hypothetical protein
MNGKKTYIGFILCGIVGLLAAFEVISKDVAVGIGAVLAPLTGVSMRHGIKKAEKAANGG